jgi:hypothetical protein
MARRGDLFESIDIIRSGDDKTVSVRHEHNGVTVQRKRANGVAK